MVKLSGQISALMRGITPVLFGVALCAVLGLGGCVATTGQAGMGASPVDARYANLLAQQYETIGGMMGVNQRHQTAALFRQRAMAAYAGIWPLPERPGGEEINAGMAAAFDELDLALRNVMGEDNALWLARAQVNYECWLHTGEETCERDYRKAMRSLSVVDDKGHRWEVYFDVDSSILSSRAREDMASLAMALRMNKAINVHLTGMTEHSSKNRSLALRRAIAVRNLLTQMGVSGDRISVADEHRTDSILGDQSPEPGQNAKARRVELILEPVFGEAI